MPTVDLSTRISILSMPPGRLGSSSSNARALASLSQPISTSELAISVLPQRPLFVVDVPPRLDVLADPALDLSEAHSGLAASGRPAGVVDDGEGPTDAGQSEPQPLQRAGDAVGLGGWGGGHQCLRVQLFASIIWTRQ